MTTQPIGTIYLSALGADADVYRCDWCHGHGITTSHTHWPSQEMWEDDACPICDGRGEVACTCTADWGADPYCPAHLDPEESPYWRADR